MLVVTIQTINADRDLVISIGFAAGGVADRDLALAICRQACRATVIWHWDDIVFMRTMTIQAINTYCDLFIRIGFTAGCMTDRDLAIDDHYWAGWATAHRHREDIVGMPKMLIR